MRAWGASCPREKRWMPGGTQGLLQAFQLERKEGWPQHPHICPPLQGFTAELSQKPKVPNTPLAPDQTQNLLLSPWLGRQQLPATCPPAGSTLRGEDAALVPLRELDVRE